MKLPNYLDSLPKSSIQNAMPGIIFFSDKLLSDNIMHQFQSESI